MEHSISDPVAEILKIERPTERFCLSPLTTAGLQARNFTRASISVSECMAPEFYAPNRSLQEEFERLCDPGFPVSSEVLLNLVVKYFCAYVDDSLGTRPVDFAELAGVFEAFGRHQSLNEPHDDIERMNRMRQWSGVLRLLADAPRMAHVLRDVLGMRIRKQDERFIGVDMGTASGLMVVAMAANARRNGFADPLVRGFMHDPVAGERTHDLLRLLGAGDVLAVLPADRRSYAWLQGRSPSMVVNERLVGMQQPLGERDFFAPYSTLATVMRDNAGDTVFYPEGVIAYCRDANMSMVISPDAGLQVSEEYIRAGLAMQGFLHGGQVVPVHRMGEEFYGYFCGD